MQQNLLASIGNFITAMNGQWTAYADLAALLQVEDLNQLPLARSEGDEVPPEPLAAPPAEDEGS